MPIGDLAAIDACWDRGLVLLPTGQTGTLTSHRADMQGWDWVNEGKHGQAKWGWVSDKPGSKLVFKVTIVHHESAQPYRPVLHEMWCRTTGCDTSVQEGQAFMYRVDRPHDCLLAELLAAGCAVFCAVHCKQLILAMRFVYHVESGQYLCSSWSQCC